jgi:hypothetical protein
MTVRFSPVSLVPLVITTVALTAVASHGGRCAAAEGFPRLVIAHHMNAAAPTAAGGQDAFGDNTPTPPRVVPGSPWAAIGGRVRDRSIGNLYGAAGRPRSEQAAWEIAVAKRAGVDAFAFYGGIPGGEGRVLEYMRAAKGTGFKITLCSSGAERGGDYEKAAASLRRLVEADRELDVLLRVDGKLLMLTYGGNWGDTVGAMTAKRRDIEARVGTPMLVLYHPQVMQASDAERNRLGALLDGGFDGLCPFMVTASAEAEAMCRFWADICLAHGTMYFAPVNFQFHSPLHMTHAPVADANWRRSWSVARNGAAGVQLVTWNDWGETSMMAPGVNANYGIYDLLREEAAAFKAGKPPEIVADDAWTLYYKYPSSAEPQLCHPPSPRKFRGPEHDFVWVLTSLTAPATVVCEGRGERAAPAGRSMVSFPLTPGPVRISISRDGKTIQTLSPPEVVTDTPWRPDHSIVAFCTDAKERAYRAEDFPGQAPRFSGEYGDDDGDGLLNWFEGLFFGDLEHPATRVGPQDDFNGTPLARAQQEFLDPIMPPAHYPIGFVWGSRRLPEHSTTPARDENGMPVWEFGYAASDAKKLRPAQAAHQWGRGGVRWSLEYPGAWHRLLDDGRLGMASGPEAIPILRWQSPVDGRVRVRGVFKYEETAGDGLAAHAQVEAKGGWAWRQAIAKGEAAKFEDELEVKRNDRLRFFCRDEKSRRQSPMAALDLSIELLQSRAALPPGDRVDPPVAVDLGQTDMPFATALWRGRYRWGEAGLRADKDGLAIFNPGDQNSRDMLAFFDSVPNATYGPLCRWGDAIVRADVQFQFGDLAPAAWGKPAFAVTTRVAPRRLAMYFLRVEVPSRQADPAKPTALLKLGGMSRAYPATAREQVFAECPVALPTSASFTMALATRNLGEDTVRLTGTCTASGGDASHVLTCDRTMRADGTSPWGEAGFAARIHESSNAPDGARRILLRTFTVEPAREIEQPGELPKSPEPR